MGKKFSYLCIAAAIVVLSARPAMATVYECKTKQAFEWENGILKPSAFYKKTILSLDDEYGNITSSLSEDAPSASALVDIQLLIGPNNDLIATTRSSVKNTEGKEVAVRNTIIHIRGWKLDKKSLKFSSANLTFILYEDSPPIILTGDCVKD